MQSKWFVVLPNCSRPKKKEEKKLSFIQQKCSFHCHVVFFIALMDIARFGVIFRFVFPKKTQKQQNWRKCVQILCGDHVFGIVDPGLEHQSATNVRYTVPNW
jgi:hypothetical protein